MRRTGNREQGSGNRQLRMIVIGRLAAHVTQCAVPECEGLVFDGMYCDRCREEIDALNALALKQQLPESSRFATLLGKVRERLWILNAILVVAGCFGWDGSSARPGWSG